MRAGEGYLHPGRGALPLVAGRCYAQLPLGATGHSRFRNKHLSFGPGQFRLLRDPDEARCERDATVLTMRLLEPPGDGWEQVRLPLDQETRRRAVELAACLRGRPLPLRLRARAPLVMLEKGIHRSLGAAARRIERLPGRSRDKRIDTYLRLERAWDHLQESFVRDPDTAELAAAAAISRAHFIRLFGRFYGVSPKQRVLELKLEAAKRLLRETPLTVGDVAQATGFGNRCAFQRTFRARVGVTPGRFRSGAGPIMRGR